MIHRVFSNLKTWLSGTLTTASSRITCRAYLNEFVFRFNRRFYPINSFNSVLGIASHVVPPTYEWKHPS